jgi:hypothetical protein
MRLRSCGCGWHHPWHDEQNRVPLPLVSAADERKALDPEVSLYDHAVRLLRQTPDGPLPDGGRPHPDEPNQPAPSPSRRAGSKTRQARLLSFLEAFFANPAGSLTVLQTRLCELAPSERTVCQVLDSLPKLDPRRAQDTGLALLRTARDRRAVWLGLGLLARTSEPVDTEPIRTLALLDCCSALAIKALAAVPGTAADLIWLTERVPTAQRRAVETALQSRADEPQAREWLLVTPMDLAPSQAREVAEAVHLAEALERRPDDQRIIEQAARLLVAMTKDDDYNAQVPRYLAARQVYRLLADRAGSLSPSLDRYALLLSLLLDLHSGFSVLLDWPAGERERILDQFRAVLRSPQWAEQPTLARDSQDEGARWRAEWIDRVPAEVLSGGGRPDRLRVQVCVLDPVGRGGVETRVLVDGRPVIAEAFDRGVAHAPEALLGTGRLRATAEPREVQLAEAWCSEGCCGALYVTIVRDGDTVRWHNWRRTSSGIKTPLPELRFDAAEYDAEITRAEHDHSWEWPARRLARLIRERLHRQPDLLTRWSCHPFWISTHYAERDQVGLSFSYPQLPTFGPDHVPWAQFIWLIPVGEAPLEQQADAALRRLAEASPTGYASLTGGTREAAEALGLAWQPEGTG